MQEADIDAILFDAMSDIPRLQLADWWMLKSTDVEWIRRTLRMVLIKHLTQKTTVPKDGEVKLAYDKWYNEWRDKCTTRMVEVIEKIRSID